MRVQRLILLIAVIVISTITGCDFSANSELSEQEELFTVTDDVMSRVTYYNESAKQAFDIPVANSEATDYLSLNAQVKPPSISSGTTRASHLYYDDNKSIIVGYKIRFGDYGGGIDIIEAKDGDPIANTRSYLSEVFDVQEVIYDKFEKAMFVAGASNSKGALVLKIDPKDASVEKSTTIEGHVAKSLDVSYTKKESDSYLYVVSDLNHLYRFNKDLTLTEGGLLKAGSDVEFRSVGARYNDQIFNLDLEGNVYRTSPAYNSSSAFKLTESLSDDFRSKLAIGRISYFNESTPDNVLVATNEYGFALLNPAGQAVWSSKSDEIDQAKAIYYTSITGYQPDDKKDDPVVYAAGVAEDGSPVIDIFGVPSNKKLYYMTTLDLSDFSGVGNAQINHVYATGEYLYVAKSTDGVLIFEIK
ncbi:MAG: hypothetical protein GVY20_03360 [Bacteroidetes bacterium]|jgi:hypothetical protein|nr:hypothetical protein [Bacteroidota bacterium]